MKITQQSVCSISSLANPMDSHMSVLALNAGPNISVCCAVYMPGPSAYQLHTHYHYHHPSLLLLSVVPLSIAKPCVLSHTVSTTYNLCVPKGNSHLLTFPNASPRADKNRCCDGHVTVGVAGLTAVTLSDGPPKPRRPEIIGKAWSWASQ